MTDDYVVSTDPRTLWAALEPIHATIYFGDEHARAMKALGLKGWWMGYFASRAAPLGRVSPSVVDALFYSYEPAFVRRSLPDAWLYASPTAVLHERQSAVERTLRRVAAGQEKLLSELAEMLVPLAEMSPCSGRPLAAANQALEAPSTVAGRLWWATAVLREFRGDGHVAALMVAGVGPLECHVLAAARGRSSKETLLKNRGWSEAQWRDCEESLEDRGLLAGGVLTGTGERLVTGVDVSTDATAELVWPASQERRHAIIQLGAEISSAIAGNIVPLDNPIGNPWPLPGRRRVR